MKIFNALAVAVILFVHQVDVRADQLPPMAPGDTWTFLINKPDSTNTGQAGLVQFLVSLDSAGDLILKKRMGTRNNLLGTAPLAWPQSTDGDWKLPASGCLIDPSGIDLGAGQQICQSGLTENLTWSSQDGVGPNIRESAATVSGRQLIITSAGAFLAYKINWTQKVFADNSKSAPQIYNVTYWYSPQAKMMVKIQVERNDDHDNVIDNTALELTAFKVSGTKSDFTNQEIEAQQKLIDQRLNEQIGSYMSCKNSDSYQLSETSNGILELLKLRKASSNIDISDPLKNLFNSYKRLGGAGVRPAEVELVPNPCEPIADKMKVDVDAEVALQKSAGWSNSEVNSTTFKKPTFELASCVKPNYPRISLALEQEGVVRLVFFIGAYGIVNFSFVAKSSGTLVLDNEALAALTKCHFVPGSIDGQSRPAWLYVDYVWKLDK